MKTINFKLQITNNKLAQKTWNLRTLYDLDFDIWRLPICRVIIILAALLASYETYPYADNDLLVMGKNAVDNQDYSNAVKHLKEILKKDPNNTDARYWLGKAYHNSGRLNDAMIEILKVVELRKNDFRAHQLLGEIYHGAGNYKDAIEEYKKSLKILGIVQVDRAPAYRKYLLETYIQMGRSYKAAGESVNADDYYKKALELDPTDKRLQAEMGLETGKGRIFGSKKNERPDLTAKPDTAKTAQIEKNYVIDQGSPEIPLELKRKEYPAKEEMKIVSGTWLKEYINTYKKVISIDPGNLKAHYMLAKGYQTAGDFDNAFVEYTLITKMHPENTDAYYNIGMLYYSKGKYEEAISNWKRVLNKEPANETIKKYIEISMQNIEARQPVKVAKQPVTEGTAKGDAERDKKALSKEVADERTGKRVEISRQKIGGQSPAWFAEEDSYSSEGLVKEYFKRDFEREILISGTKIKMIAKEEEMEKYRRMIAQLEPVVDRSPKSVRQLNALGELYAKCGNFDTAMMVFNRVLAVEPQNVGAHNNIAGVYANLGRLDKALELYRNVVKKFHGMKEVAVAYNNIGELYDRKGLYDLAIDNYKNALLITPRDADIHYNLGLAYKHTGALKEAIEELKIASHYNPNNPDIYNNLGIIYFSQGRVNDAINEYTSALEIDPNNSYVLNNLGFAYEEKGLYDKAEEHYNAAIYYKEDYLRAYMNLGVIYYYKGLYTEAAKQYKKVVSISPRSKLAMEAKGRIRQLEELAID